jgi:hypothetical protein
MKQFRAFLLGLGLAATIGSQGAAQVRDRSIPVTLVTEWTHRPTGRQLFVSAGTPQTVAIQWIDVLGKVPDRTTLIKLVSDNHTKGLLAVRAGLPSGGGVYLEVAWGDFAVQRHPGAVVRLEDRSTGRILTTDPAATTADSDSALKRLVAASSEADLVALMKEYATKGVRSCSMQLPSNLDVSVRVFSQPRF